MTLLETTAVTDFNTPQKQILKNLISIKAKTPSIPLFFAGVDYGEHCSFQLNTKYPAAVKVNGHSRVSGFGYKPKCTEFFSFSSRKSQ